jgi:Leucine-rich repeat (LRR) protein
MYPQNTERFVFLGDLFYAFVLQNNFDIMTMEITEDLLEQYFGFYYRIKDLNLMDSNLQQEGDVNYIREINGIMNTYNEYFMNHHRNMNINAVDDGTIVTQLDFSRFADLNEILMSEIAINSIRNIPAGVKTLHITHCYLKTIDRIPRLLEYMNCAHNQLERLPELHFAPYLKTLICNHNKLDALPLRLPNSIIRIYCSYNRITAFPNQLPKQLKVLECNHNRIFQLCVLPQSLTVLSCGFNQIRELPCLTLLHQLKILLCNNNRIEELPPMPFCLQQLNHQNNPIRNFFPYHTGVFVM